MGRVAQCQRRQPGAVRAGLCPQLGGAEGPAMLVEYLKSATASLQHPPALTSRLSPERLAMPADDADDGRAAQAVSRRYLQVPVSLVAAPELHGDAPGEQVRGGGLVRAESRQPRRTPL